MNFCPKCGNDVRGAKFCSKCGKPVNIASPTDQQKKKSVFQRIIDAQKERERIEREKEGHQWVEKHLAEEEMLKWEKEYAILEEHRKDVMPFFEMAEDIEKKYTILINIDKNFDSDAANVLISLCRKHIDMKKRLDNKWNGYEHHDIYTYAYQRIAMIYEKQGHYDLAAETCVQAINEGYLRDRTNGGMPGRLARMIKRGKLEMTPEMEIALKKELS